MKCIPRKYLYLKNEPIDEKYSECPNFYLTYLLMKQMIEDSGRTDVHCEIAYTRGTWFIRIWSGETVLDEFGFTQYPNKLEPNPQKRGILEIWYFPKVIDAQPDEIEFAISELTKYLRTTI